MEPMPWEEITKDQIPPTPLPAVVLHVRLQITIKLVSTVLSKTQRHLALERDN